MSWRRGQSYSSDLRERVLAAVDRGMAVREAALLFSVSISFIYKAQKRRRLTGETAPSHRRGHPPQKLAGHESALLACVEAAPDTTIAELRAWALAKLGVRLSTGAMWAALERLGLTLKKRSRVRPSRTVRMLPPPGLHGASARAP